MNQMNPAWWFKRGGWRCHSGELGYTQCVHIHNRNQNEGSSMALSEIMELEHPLLCIFANSSSKFTGISRMVTPFWNCWVQLSAICNKNKWRETVREKNQCCSFQFNTGEGQPGLRLCFCHCSNWWDHECWNAEKGFRSSCFSFSKVSNITFEEKNSWEIQFNFI